MNGFPAANVTVRRLAAPDEEHVAAVGRPKLDLRARTTNLAGVAFYEKLGYVLEERASFGKRREDGA
jgi:ribosomal protein S18 acetylase RimI-like enzyme